MSAAQEGTAGAAIEETSEQSAISQLAGRVAARRARFRDAVGQLAERAQSADLLKTLLAPAAFALFGGFIFMFLGWYGASHTFRQIEQVPYLISGGLIGLAMVFVGTMILASAFWMNMLQKFNEQAEERHLRQLHALEERLRNEMTANGTPRSSSRTSSRAKSDSTRTRAKASSKK